MTDRQLLANMQGLLDHPEHPLLSASVGIIRNGEVIFAHTVGTRYIDPVTYKIIPADEETKYRMASISKLLTATGIWQLIEKRMISPETDAGDVLGFPLRNPNYPNVPITIGMLLSHTSSIREGSDDVICTYHIPFPHHVREFFQKGTACYYPGCWAGPEEEPGKFFSYCNFNYGLLGTIIERVSGERFDIYMKKHIFEPLELDCGFFVPTMLESARQRIGTLYRKLDTYGRYDPRNGLWRVQYDDYSEGFPSDFNHYSIGTNATLFSPQGGLRASVKDMMCLMRAWMGQESFRLLSDETIQRMAAPVWTYDRNLHNGDCSMDQCYARGPQVFLNRKGLDCLAEHVQLPFIGHGAGAYGLLGTLGMDIKKKNGIMVAVTGTGGHYPGVYSRNNRWEEILLTAAAEYASFDYPAG